MPSYTRRVTLTVGMRYDALVDNILLSRYLQDGYAAMDELTRDATLDQPSLAAAVHSAIAHTHARETVVATSLSKRERDLRPDAVVVAYNLSGLPGICDSRSDRTSGHTAFGMVAMGRSDVHDWEEAAVTGRGAAHERRDAILSLLLALATVAVPSVEEIVASDWSNPALLERYEPAGVLLWWQARMQAGMSPDAARTLLSLVANPALLSSVRWTEAGHPVAETTLPATTDARVA